MSATSSVLGSTSGSLLARTATMAAAKGLPFNMVDRASKRYSVSALYSMAAEQDEEVEDELAREQRALRDLKARISAQSKRNFILERDVRYLDSRIALLIQNRMALHEQQEVASHLEETEQVEGTFPDDRKKQHYGNLFFLLQAEPRHIAHLTRLVSLSEIDTLLQTVMFTLYGNQYESREEHLLLTMFQSVLAAQFETATDFGSLLRANTPVSRMMTTYTRRGPGQSYLKHVLADSINQIIEDRDTDLEINPVKVYARMIKEMEDAGIPCDLPRSVPPNIAAENEQVQKIIAPRIQKLSDLANQLLDTILASIDHVPYGIRWICKQIRSLTKRKYPNATEYSICSLIGGFFFLRFVNPAIVTPNAYMLVDSVPQKNPRRTLTLLAKILQNLANKPSYAKEPYMMSLSSFTEENKKRTNEFLNNLCEVGDFYESLEMDQYMALSKKDLSLSITLNELYNTHALLEQHLDVLAPSESDHLRIILSELGPAPPQVSRAENRTIELPLFSRWETPINDFNNMLTGDNSLSQSDILFMETKSIFVQLLRCMPHMARRNFVLPAVAEAAATSKDAMLVRKGIKVADMLRELEELGVVSRMDNYKLLTEEVKQELVHLGNLREKVAREIASLESVYKTICDHNQYLRSQLDSYKAYLQNVRLQASSVDIKKNKPSKPIGPIKFTHQQLEKDGVIVESNVPENRRSNIFFNIASPSPGTFVISLHYKGREKAILEMDLKLDDLLEKQQDNVQLLDLEYVQLNVARLLALLNRTFMKK